MYAPDVPYDIEFNPINMLILLDRSRSMLNNQLEDQTFAALTATAIKEITATADERNLINFVSAFFLLGHAANARMRSPLTTTTPIARR